MKLAQLTILAIDSAIGISSAAIWRGGKVAAYLEDRESGMQAAKLVPLVEATLKQANIAYTDLTAVAATIGPGSFTGIRIGLATARGIAFAAGIPCLGFTTLEVMHAALCHPDENRDPALQELDTVVRRYDGELCILNAGKGEVFYQVFGETITESAIGRLEEIISQYPNAKLACGVPLPAGYSAAITHPRADALAALAASHPERAQPPSPFYIRPPDAKPQSALCSAP